MGSEATDWVLVDLALVDWVSEVWEVSVALEEAMAVDMAVVVDGDTKSEPNVFSNLAPGVQFKLFGTCFLPSLIFLLAKLTYIPVIPKKHSRQIKTLHGLKSERILSPHQFTRSYETTVSQMKTDMVESHCTENDHKEVPEFVRS